MARLPSRTGGGSETPPDDGNGEEPASDADQATDPASPQDSGFGRLRRRVRDFLPGGGTPPSQQPGQRDPADTASREGDTSQFYDDNDGGSGGTNTDETQSTSRPPAGGSSGREGDTSQFYDDTENTRRSGTPRVPESGNQSDGGGATGIAEFRQRESESLEAPVPSLEDNRPSFVSRRVQDPYAAMRADVPDDAPAPIEFFERPDGSTAIGLFTRRGDKPDDFTEISAGDALDETFATPDTDITTQLVDEGGFFSEQGEADLKSRASEIQDFYGIGEEADQFVTDVTGSEKAGAFASGIGKLPGETIAAVDQTVLAAEYGAETAQNFGDVAREEGIEATVDAIGESFGAAGKGIGQAALDKPYEFTGGVVGGVLAGSAAFKGIEKAGDAARASRLSTKPDVNLEDVTTDAGARGELPKFDTDPNAPAEDAVREISDRASDNPDVVTEGTGGSTLYHGTQSKFDAEFDVGEGASELPGLFTSPEASPISLQGLRSGGVDLPSLKPRLPDPTGKSDRFLGLPGDDVRPMDPDATGAGYALKEGDDVIETGLGRGEAKSKAADADALDVVSDPTTSGYEFLTERAEPGAAYVRPAGGRTSELEAIFPPESGFTKTGTLGVRVGRRQVPGTDVDIPLTGRTVPLDLFERGDGPNIDVDADDGGLETMTPGDAATFESIANDVDRLTTPEGSVGVGGGLTGGSIGGATATGPSSGGLEDSQLADEDFGEFSSGTDLDEPLPGDSTDLFDDTSMFDDPDIGPTSPMPDSDSQMSGGPTPGSPPSTSGPSPGPSGGAPSGVSPTGPPTDSVAPTGGDPVPTPPGSDGPPSSDGRPPTSGPPSGTFPTYPTGGPGDSPDPLTPQDFPEPDLDPKKKDERKKKRGPGFTEVFSNPVITPEEIGGGDVDVLDSLGDDLAALDDMGV